MPDPPPFLSVLLHRPDAAIDLQSGERLVGLTGVCAGYERGTWRCEQFAEYLIETWLPEFALRHSELTHVTPRNMGRLIRRAARAVYETEKYEKRGEFGELILHAIVCQIFEAIPAVSKIYYKDGPNETVKGFDGVHVVADGDRLELWLGEAKFYGDPAAAIRDAIESLGRLQRTHYLRGEFAAIVHKIDDAWPHADRLRTLLDRNTSLDRIFDSACVPVLLTYDSTVVASHRLQDEAYVRAVTEEWEAHHASFAGRNLPPDFRVHLILVPLGSKAHFVTALDTELRRWQ